MELSIFNRYWKQLGEAISLRPKVAISGIPGVAILVVAGTVAYIVLAIIAVPPGEVREFQFVSEDGAITALSAMLLSAASAFSFTTYFILRFQKDHRKFLWILLTFGFAFLAFDELLQFHERLGSIADRLSSSGSFRNWNDIIVISYGVIAVLIGTALLPSLLRFPLVAEFFATGFVFYVIHTAIDSMAEPKTTISVILEESAKIFSVEFLAMGAFVGCIGVFTLTPNISPRKH